MVRMKTRASSITTCCWLVSEFHSLLLAYNHCFSENMHCFIAEMSQLELGSVSGFLKEAEAIYNENLHAYIKIVLRRPFAKITVRTICCSFLNNS